jgi:hypothetical protein
MNTSQRTLSAGVVISLATVVLTGCATPPQEINQPKEATAIESTLTDEQALALAEETYSSYLVEYSKVIGDGSGDTQLISPYLTEERLRLEEEELKILSSEGLRIVGKPSFRSISISQISTDSYQVSICLSGLDTKVIDSAGKDVTPASRPAELPLQVTMHLTSKSTFKISESQAWSGQNFC